MNPFKDIFIRGLIVLMVGLVMLILMLWIQGCAHLQKTPQDEFLPFEYGFKTRLSVKDQYNKSLLWMANTYRNINSVVTYKSEEQGVIRGRSRFCEPYDKMGYSICATYQIDIDCKDGYVKMLFHSLDGISHVEADRMVPGMDVTYAEQYKIARKHFMIMAVKWMGTL